MLAQLQRVSASSPCLQDVQRCLARLPASGSATEEGEATCAAAVACVGACVAAAASCCPAELTGQLVEVLLTKARDRAPTVRREALLALQAVAAARFDLLRDRWAACADALHASVRRSQTQGTRSAVTRPAACAQCESLAELCNDCRLDCRRRCTLHPGGSEAADRVPASIWGGVRRCRLPTCVPFGGLGVCRNLCVP